MPSIRHRLQRVGALAILVAFLTGLFAVPLLAANSAVTGTLTFREHIALTPNAVAIVTIVDTTAAPDAGAIIGQQRINGPTTLPIDFSVLIDAAAIDQTHAYALFATIVDGETTWQNRVAEPVITGGPTSGINLTLPAVSATSPGAIAGAIVPPAGTIPTTQAVSFAALIKVETGTLVARQVRPITDPANLSYSIGYDPSVIDPAATYVVKGGIVDGAAAWQNRAGVPAIQGGVPVSSVSLPVTLAPTGIPVVSAAPTAAPSATPTAVPTVAPTAAPSSSTAPSAAPTAVPTASPAPTPTPIPTASPTPIPTPTLTPRPTLTPTPIPTASPTPSVAPSSAASPSNAPSPTPVTAVTGTLTYREPHTMTGDAFAVVALVRGSARATDDSIVASIIDRDITKVPVAFALPLAGVTIDPSSIYTIQATIVDGDNAWVTAKGVPVLTKGNPSTVAITLAYRPDLLKGVVSGQVTALGAQLSPTAYSMAVLLDPATGESLGIDVRTVDSGLPVAFAIPFTITDIQRTSDYVVTAEIGDNGSTWQNLAGVPVITKGNPKSGVQVVVSAVAAPSPSATPSPTPAPSAAPIPAPDKRSDGGLLSWIIIIAIIAAIAAFLIARGRNSTDAVDAGAPAGGVDPTDAIEATDGAAATDAAATAEAVPPHPADPAADADTADPR